MTSAAFITDIALQRTAPSSAGARREVPADKSRDFGRMMEEASRNDRPTRKEEFARRDETARQDFETSAKRIDTRRMPSDRDSSRIETELRDEPPRRTDQDRNRETASDAARFDERDQPASSAPLRDDTADVPAAQSEESGPDKPAQRESETAASDSNEKESATAGDQAQQPPVLAVSATQLAGIGVQSLANAIGADQGDAATAAAPAGPLIAETGITTADPAGAATLPNAAKSMVRKDSDIATLTQAATDEAGANNAAAATPATDTLGAGKKALTDGIKGETGSGTTTGSSDQTAAKNATKGETTQATHQATAAVKELAAAVEGAKPQSAGLTQVASSAIAPSASAETQTAARPADPAQAMARPDAPVPLQAIAVEIGMRAMRGSREFSIRLDPEDLGRIDIRLEISEAGQVQAKLVVDKVETLQLLQRDARTLERAFDQAGLKTSPDGLQFSLRDSGQQNRQSGQQDRSSTENAAGGKADGAGLIDDIALRPAIYRTTAAGGLDIRI